MSEIIKEMLSNGVQSVLEGDSSGLQLYCDLSALEKYVKECKDAINDVAQTEARSYGSKEFAYHGFKVAVRSSAGRWDYKGISAWNTANAEVKKIEELAKATFSMKQKGLTVVDGDEILEGATYTAGKETLFISGKGE